MSCLPHRFPLSGDPDAHQATECPNLIPLRGEQYRNNVKIGHYAAKWGAESPERIGETLRQTSHGRKAGDDGGALPLWGVEGRGARGGGAVAPPRHRQGRAVGARAWSAPRATASALRLHEFGQQTGDSRGCKLSATTLRLVVCTLLYFLSNGLTSSRVCVEYVF